MWTFYVLPFILFPLSIGLKESGEISTADFKHIILLPDVHGDYQTLLRALHLAYVAIEGEHIALPYPLFEFHFQESLVYGAPDFPLSIARDVILIQMGDIIDRGPFSVTCMEIVAAIPTIIGWESRILYGNHEFVSMVKPAVTNQRLVHPMDMHMCDTRVELAMNSIQESDPPTKYPGWGRDVLFLAPPFQQSGFQQISLGSTMFDMIHKSSLAMVRLSSSSPPGRVDDLRNPATLFVHAGVDLPWLAQQFPWLFEDSSSLQETESIIDRLNDEVDDILLNIGDTARAQPLIEPGSFLWTRYLSQAEETAEFCQDIVGGILQLFQVARVVVGHTVQKSPRAVRSRCGGRVLLTDVGMSRWISKPRLHADTQSMDGAHPSVTIMDVSNNGQSVKQIRAFYWSESDGVTVHPLYTAPREPLYFPLGPMSRRVP